MRRRQILQSMGGLMATAVLRTESATIAQAQEGAASTDVTGRLARYMVEARDRALPPEVVLAAKHRILDTLGAIISGAQLKPGEMAIRFLSAQGGTPEASVPVANIKTSAISAALAAGMFAHADETDDFEPITKA